MKAKRKRAPFSCSERDRKVDDRQNKHSIFAATVALPAAAERGHGGAQAMHPNQQPAVGQIAIDLKKPRRIPVPSALPD
jgi:hypothetical protein